MQIPTVITKTHTRNDRIALLDTDSNSHHKTHTRNDGVALLDAAANARVGRELLYVKLLVPVAVNVVPLHELHVNIDVVPTGIS